MDVVNLEAGQAATEEDDYDPGSNTVEPSHTDILFISASKLCVEDEKTSRIHMILAPFLVKVRYKTVMDCFHFIFK